MKKYFILLLFVFSFLFYPKNTYAYDGSAQLNTFTNSELMDFYYTMINPSENLFVCYKYSMVNIRCHFGNSQHVPTLYNSSGTLYFIYFDNNGNQITDNFGNLSNSFYYQFPLSARPNYTFSPQGMGNVVWSNYASTVYSNYDVKDTDGNVVVTKNLDYTPVSTCPPCEECEECEECPLSAGFPFNKEEFYVLLCLIGVLISMNFLKWCFPMNRRK